MPPATTAAYWIAAGDSPAANATSGRSPTARSASPHFVNVNTIQISGANR